MGAASHGGSAVVEDEKIRYADQANYNRPDSFTYTMTDDGTTNRAADAKSDTATVSVSVSEVNDAPVAVDDSRGPLPRTTCWCSKRPA